MEIRPNSREISRGGRQRQLVKVRSVPLQILFASQQIFLYCRQILFAFQQILFTLQQILFASQLMFVPQAQNVGVRDLP